jgi:hypothetical protein
LAGAAEKTDGKMKTAAWLVSDRPQRKGKSDQRKRECGKSRERRTMQCALVMLMLTLRGRSRAIRMGQTEFKSRGGRSRGELRNEGAGQYRVEHQRIGGDPADELSPKPQPGSSPCGHPTPFGCTLTSSRSGQDTVQQKFIA